MLKKHISHIHFLFKFLSIFYETLPNPGLEPCNLHKTTFRHKPFHFPNKFSSKKSWSCANFGYAISDDFRLKKNIKNALFAPIIRLVNQRKSFYRKKTHPEVSVSQMCVSRKKTPNGQSCMCACVACTYVCVSGTCVASSSTTSAKRSVTRDGLANLTDCSYRVGTM